MPTRSGKTSPSLAKYPRPVSGRYADVAQQVVHCPDKAEGVGSTPTVGTMGRAEGCPL